MEESILGEYNDLSVTHRSMHDKMLMFVEDGLGDINIIRNILGKIDKMLLRYFTKDGYLPIHKAIVTGNLRCVMELTKLDVDTIKFQTKDKKFTSAYLAVKVNRPEILRFVLEIDPIQASIQSEKGLPIHLAILDKRTEIVKDLIKLFPECLTTPKNDGRFAIHLAATRTAQQVVLVVDANRELLQQRDGDGNYPQHFAAIMGSIDALKAIFGYLENEEAMKNCLRATNHTRCTSLYMACSSGHVEMVRFILEVCRDCALIPAAKDTLPIHIACQQRHEGVVKVILQLVPECARGVRVDGMLPLNMAFREGQLPSIEMTKTLIKIHPLGAFNKDSTGKNPLEVILSTEYALTKMSQRLPDAKKQTQTNLLKSVIVGDDNYNALTSKRTRKTEKQVLPVAHMRILLNAMLPVMLRHPKDLDSFEEQVLNPYSPKILAEWIHLAKECNYRARRMVMLASYIKDRDGTNLFKKLRLQGGVDVWRYLISFV